MYWYEEKPHITAQCSQFKWLNCGQQITGADVSETDIPFAPEGCAAFKWIFSSAVVFDISDFRLFKQNSYIVREKCIPHVVDRAA